MTRLDQLFPDGPRAEGVPAFVVDDRHTVNRLTQLIGAPRSTVTRVPATDVVGLAGMVDRAAADTRPAEASRAVLVRGSRRRPHRRVDVLTISTAALAVVAVVTAAVVGGIQAASASPAADSLKVLESDEAEIQNATQALSSGIDRLNEQVRTERADAAALKTALETMRSVPDPTRWEWEDPRTVPLVGAAALDAAIAEQDAYIAALAAVDLPAKVGSYTRADIDEDSLDEVATAIDDAQTALGEIDDAAAALRDARTRVGAVVDAHAAKLQAYADTYATLATTLVEDNGDAERPLRDAVSTAGAAVVSSRLAGPAGVEALMTFRDAAIALMADQVRVIREQEEQARRDAAQNNGGTDPGTGGSGQGDGGTPTDPATPPPTDPATPPPADSGSSPEG